MFIEIPDPFMFFFVMGLVVGIELTFWLNPD